VLLEKRDRQGKSRAQNQLWIELKGGSKFAGGQVVLILLQSVVALAQVGFRCVPSGGTCFLGSGSADPCAEGQHCQ
jgi:hypothetical protein